ncbi:MAG: hypothetical protein FRX48_05769 [Lasallia pustulata]|uniref:Uncharacterized protein n=1 Tax=Lasallia pustulata TaxID=136370 RepID=A0A5M8PMX8_9LECA|nr:MAG: hypothetical protein FRX48_05769 [Lasallia pustulata]
MEAWEYTASSGIIVPFEFLAQGAGFVPLIRAAREITAGGGKRAGLGELAIMKARTWLARDEQKGLHDFKFLLTKMEEMGEDFPVLAPEDGEEMGDGKRTGLGELAIMKARTWLARDELKDLHDFKFLLTKMEEMGEDFPVLAPEDGEEMGDLKTLTTAAEDAGGLYEGLLRRMLRS